MQKETLTIDQNDDITDLLAKFKASDKDLVVLVAPAKPGILLSSVNLKLLARAAKNAKRQLIIVSTNEKLQKLALECGLPVANSLKSRPLLPSTDSVQKDIVTAKKTAETDAETTAVTTPAEEENSADAFQIQQADDVAESEANHANTKANAKSADSDGKASSTPKKAAKTTRAKSKTLWARHKYLFIGLPPILMIAASFLAWALIVAPKVSLSVNVRTSSSNFSENISFSTAPADESLDTGVFYAHEESLVSERKVEFNATGKKDLGERASGSLVIYYQNHDSFRFNLPAGTTFSYKGLEFVSLASAELSWDGEDEKACSAGSSIKNGCIISKTISVRAAEPGEKYNLDASQTGWVVEGFQELSAYNSSDLAGGNSKLVTVVQQSDIDAAVAQLSDVDKEAAKAELVAKFSGQALPLTDSFKVEIGEAKVTPALGEEVPEGTTPVVSAKLTYKILSTDLTRLERFIESKANLAEGMKVYSVGAPFVEYFSETSAGHYSARLKTTLKSGPQISETEILNRISGQKIGRVEPILRDNFPGISKVEVEKSYFWVSSVPNDPNKISVELKIDE